MSLAPDLAAHLLRQPIPVPSRWALNRARLELDFATMIFCRKHILNVHTPWFAHVRADASPQGGRDYLVCELDYCSFPPECPNEHVTKLLEKGGQIRSRLLPLAIVGAKAASAAHKGKLLLSVLALESASLSETLNRTMSLLFDYGAEAGIWKLSAAHFLGESQAAASASGALVLVGDLHAELARVFPRALPLPDADHSLHHAT